MCVICCASLTLLRQVDLMKSLQDYLRKVPHGLPSLWQLYSPCHWVRVVFLETGPLLTSPLSLKKEINTLSQTTDPFVSPVLWWNFWKGWYTANWQSSWRETTSFHRFNMVSKRVTHVRHNYWRQCTNGLAVLTEPAVLQGLWHCASWASPAQAGSCRH